MMQTKNTLSKNTNSVFKSLNSDSEFSVNISHYHYLYVIIPITVMIIIISQMRREELS